MQKNSLIHKLEGFIKKYYQNQLLKGTILGISLILLAFFALSFFEYFGRFSIGTRTTLFYTYILMSLGVLGWYIIRPILGLVNVSRKFGIKQASALIGSHFPEVKDKLLNTLQLQAEAQSQDNQLLLASIDQRVSQLSPVPFANAIAFKKNLKYVKYALLPAFALGFILLVSPGFKKSSERVVNFNRHFEIEAPFTFNSNIENQQAIQNQNITVPLLLDGLEIPKDAYIHIGKQRYKMRSNKSGEFNYVVNNIQKTENIYFEAGGFESKEYKIDIALKPSLIGYSATITYPRYLGIAPETIRNIGELSVPQGTQIQWNFDTKNVENILVAPDNLVLKPSSNKASFNRRFMTSTLLKVKTKNKEVAEGDSVFYQINVIPDEFPQIAVERKEDSLSNKTFYFLGDISDDHGFSKLQFHYKFTKSDSLENQSKAGILPIKIDPSLGNQNFYHYWSLDALNVQAEDEIEYYFTVWDNDGVNGAKPTKTATSTYRAPSLKELKEQTEEANKEIKSSMAGAQADAAELEKEINSIEKMLTEKKNLDWNDKKKIQDLLDKQKALEEKIRAAIDKNLEKNRKEQEFTPIQEDILEKQKLLEELMEEVLDDETKKLMEKIQELLDKNQKNELQEALEDFKFSEKEMSKEMDRMLELFKELELEQKLNETIEKLNKLAKKEKELSEKAKKEKGKSEDLQKKQEDLKKEFDDVKKDLEDIQKKNNDLETPLELSDQKEQKESISEKMDDAKEKSGKGKNKEASESMEDAAEKMKEMAEKMQQEMEESYEEQQEEDYNNLRQILENLVQLSFDQEEVIEGFKENKRYSPVYVELRQKQRKIKDETKMVEDSLLALSKRNIQIQSFVNGEVAKVNDNLNKSLKYLGERYTNNAIVHQQYAMTGYNNLALMLSESLKNMQDQMKADKQNKGKPKKQCKKPGSSGKKGNKPKKPNANAIKKMQQELAKQIKELQEGQKSGKGKPGSKEFAQMAEQQSAIRKKMQELNAKLQKEGKGGSLGDLKRTQDLMDDLEEDLYNKRLNSQTLKKLNQIEIKLSEHERAEREQEQDDKRTSNEGQEQERPIPPSIKKYLEQKKKETELLRNVSPELQPYYQKKVKEYFAD
ncbi:MAG: hypothetical protein COA58_09310 [Bacteroidetes bacterium]|nr:MAG: hypothetical protein COA58_09310 [Bacteroidota bacterium]